MVILTLDQINISWKSCFFQLDLITYALSQEKITTAEDFKHRLSAPLTVLLNHRTLMMGAKHFVYPVSVWLFNFHKVELFILV